MMNATLVRLLAALLFGFGTQVLAQSDDLPGRVGRVADIGGTVYLSTEEDADDWIAAVRNSTVTTGDNLWVSGDGRAEIDYGGGQFRLARDTNVHIARLDDRAFALFVAQGRVIVRVRVLEAGEVVQVDTPNTQVMLARPGLYRIEVSEDRERTGLVVRLGEATVAIATGLQQVLPGQSATVSGADSGSAEVRSGYGVDGFDTWSAERDRRYERSRSATYVSRQMIGYADLDDHGQWETTADYGAVWYPTTVVAGWAPYRHGRWSWVGGYGWTWLDDAPWGYAPFHYGRWVFVGSRWGWCPGAFIARPAWAPALVGWYGGSRWSASLSFGAPVWGWVPLGWGEPYHPGWRHCSDRCWNRYNRPYAVHHAEHRRGPPARYVNLTAPGGATAVPQATFTRRAPVQTNLVAVRPQRLNDAPVLAHAPAIDRQGTGTPLEARPVVAAPAPAGRIYRERPTNWVPHAQPATRQVIPSVALPRPVAPSPSATAPSAPQVQPRAAQPITRSVPGTFGTPARAVQETRPPTPRPAQVPQATINREVRPQPSAQVAPLPRSAPQAAPAVPVAPRAVQTPPQQQIRREQVPVAPQAVPTAPLPQGAHAAPPPQPARNVQPADKPAPRGREGNAPPPAQR
jgi:hypothetical protein